MSKIDSKPTLELKLEAPNNMKLPKLDLSTNKIPCGGQDLMAALKGEPKSHSKKDTRMEEPVRQESKQKDRFSDWED